MIFEMEQFDPADIAQITNGHLVAHGMEFDTRDVFYLPMHVEDWRRLKQFWQSTGIPQAKVSRYWQNRRSSFLYVYARSQETICISGYFKSGYVGQFIDGPAQRFNRPANAPRQDAFFHDFIRHVGSEIRAWYPLLPSLIDFYDLHKNHNTAALMRAHTPSLGASAQVLEIGAGGCLLPLMLHRMGGFTRYQVIDLPFVIPLGFAMLRHFAPEIPVSLPNEPAAASGVVFQTNDSPRIDPANIDAAVNVTSFGEMSEANLTSYFELLAQCLKPGGSFTCVNRDAKTTRFADYPWDGLSGEILIDEEDPISGYHHEDWTIRRRVVRVG